MSVIWKYSVMRPKCRLIKVLLLLAHCCAPAHDTSLCPLSPPSLSPLSSSSSSLQPSRGAIVWFPVAVQAALRVHARSRTPPGEPRGRRDAMVSFPADRRSGSTGPTEELAPAGFCLSLTSTKASPRLSGCSLTRDSSRPGPSSTRTSERKSMELFFWQLRRCHTDKHQWPGRWAVTIHSAASKCPLLCPRTITFLCTVTKTCFVFSWGKRSVAAFHMREREGTVFKVDQVHPQRSTVYDKCCGLKEQYVVLREDKRKMFIHWLSWLKKVNEQSVITGQHNLRLCLY